jgi:exonuclease SbcC
MNLLRLKLKCLNSLHEEITLDFENGPLSETSLFAITGPTGSGKSTLLDALSVALYHKTPRLDGSAARNPDNLLSQGAREGFAEVLFEAGQQRYLAEWRVKRSRGNNLQSSVKLIEADSGILLNDKKQNNPIPEILGLDFNSFRRSVLLAQGEFAAFLKADSREKRLLLESITGMGIYDQLGEILNQQRAKVKNEYERLESTLANIPKSDAAEICATESELNTIQAKLTATEKEWQAAREIREAETLRFKNWQQLQQAETQFRELETQQPQMDALSQEIAAARLAAELLPFQQAFEQEQKNLQEIENRQEGLKQKLARVQTELEVAEKEFSERDLQFSREKKGSVEKFKQINLAAQEEIQAVSLEAESQKRAREFETQEAEIQEKGTQLRQKKQQKQALENGIRDTKKFLAENPVPSDSSARLSQLNQDVATLREQRTQLAEIKAEGENRRTQVKNLTDKSVQLTQARAAAAEKRDRIARQKDDVNAMLQPILAAGDEPFWENRKSQIQSLQEIALAFENRQSRILELKPRQLNQTTAIQAGQVAARQLQEKLERLKIESSELEARLLALRRQEHETELAGFAVHLRVTELKPGAPCPVCGALDHPWAEITEAKNLALDDIRANLVQTETALRECQHAQQQANQALSALQATLSQQEGVLQDVTQQLAQLQAADEPDRVAWEAIFPGTEIGSQRVKIELQNCESQIKKIRTSREQFQKLGHELDVENGRVENLTTEEKLLGEQVGQVNSEIELLIERYRQFQTKIKQTETGIQQRLPAEFAANEASEGIRLFQEQVEKYSTAEKELARLQQDFGQNEIFLNENEKHISQLRQRQNNLQKEIQQYQNQARELKDRAVAKTNGVPAETARVQLEQQLEALEKQRNTVQQQLLTAQNEQTKTEVSWQDLAQNRQQVIVKFETAQKKYLDSVTAAGFGVPQKHQAALRSRDWQQTQEKALQTFHQHLFSLAQEVEKQRQEFEKIPFEEAKLAATRQHEETLSAAIQQLNTARGTLAEKLKQQQENLERYQKLERDWQAAKSDFERWQQLYELIGVNRLRDYALKSMFDLLIQFANLQMRKLTGRYKLKVKDMKDMVVVDTWNASEERPVETLSGGESFLSSLALALALSELSKGRAQLGSLFLDEGFGSLDVDSLESALDALESLRLSGRRVGVISHVQELTRRIPVRIALTRKGDGSSTVEVTGTI